MKQKILLTIATGLTMLVAACAGQDQPQGQTPGSLKEAFQNDFVVGTALSARQIMGQVPEAQELTIREFNTITPENVMKWGVIHPTRDSFRFEVPDRYVEFGEAHDMFIVGHTLVWHSQLAPWAEALEDSASLGAAMTDHIQTLVGRYKGRVNGWDVVNEALNEDGTLRETVFLDKMGEDYIRTAFALAAEVDPEAELYYNDYNLANKDKREGAVALAKKLIDSGTRIDGIGMQGHWNLNSPSIREIEESILAYSELGLKVMITELDITVLPAPWDMEGADVNVQFTSTDPTMNPYTEGLPDSVSRKLAKRYEEIFELFLKHQDKISRVTFWGVNDGASWKNGWPIPGRTDYPLLFDRDYQPKEAYERVVELKSSE